MTHAQLNKNFSELEKQRAKLIEELSRYDDKVLNKKPHPEAWSVMEILSHLIVSEQSAVRYLQKKTLDHHAGQKTGIGESMRVLLLKVALHLPFKFNAPDTAIPDPTYTTLIDAGTLWSTTRRDMQAVWMQMPEYVLDRDWFKHPFAGRLDFRQMLQFLDWHIRRHEQQIWKTIKLVSL